MSQLGALTFCLLSWYTTVLATDAPCGLRSQKAIRGLRAGLALLLKTICTPANEKGKHIMISIRALISSALVGAVLLLSAGTVSASSLTARSDGGTTISTIQHDEAVMTADKKAIQQAITAASARGMLAVAAARAACGNPSSAQCAAANLKVLTNAKALLSIGSVATAAAGLYREAAPLGSMAKRAVNHNKLRPWALEFTTWLNGEAKDQKIIVAALMAVRG